MSSSLASVRPTTGRAAERLTWARLGLGLEDIGLSSTDALFEPKAHQGERWKILEDDPQRLRLRLPLPGAPDARGNLLGRPGPLGTGWLWLSSYRGAWRSLARVRLSAPRSASLAEREWNLLCHLRAHGVGTPEPLLVGARGAGLVSSRSFLLVHAPDEAFPLERWLRTDGIGAERGRGLEALGRTLALLVRSGVALPGLRPEHLWLTPSGSGECETHVEEGPRKNKLPSVLLTDVREGRLHAEGGRASVEHLLEGLEPLFDSGELTQLARFIG